MICTVYTVLIHIFNSTVALICEFFIFYIVKRNDFRGES